MSRLRPLLLTMAYILPRSLLGRIFALYAVALFIFMAVGMGFFYTHQLTEKLEDEQSNASVVAEITAQAVAESAVIGDYEAVRQILMRALSGTDFRQAIFIDLQGGRLVQTHQAEVTPVPPPWLVNIVRDRLLDANMNIRVGGRDYGVLRLLFHTERVAADLWQLTLAGLELAGISLLIGLLVLRLLVGRWLTQLSQVQTLEQHIQDGDMEAKLDLGADVPTEIRQTFEVFSRATDTLRSQYGQRIDALMNALVQQKRALDSAAIVAEIDPSGTILSVNDLFCTTLGMQRDHVVGMPLFGQNQTLQGEIWRGLIHTQAADGRDLWLNRTLVPVENPDCGVEKWISIDLDITAQKRAEQDVHQAIASSRELAESHLRAILDTVGEGFVLQDPRGFIAISNERFRQFFPDFLHFRPTPDGQPRRQQLTDGRWMRAVEYKGQDDSIVGLYSDISEQVKLEQELRLAKEQAEAGSRSKSEFLATMSHEIRTPMNGIIGMTSLLLDTSLTDEQRRCADTVRSSAESLLNIINDILDFSKIEAGRLEFEEAPFDLTSLVDGVVDLLLPKVRGGTVSLQADIAPQLVGSYVGDGGRLRQVLLNLVGNAIKFTQQGSVMVRAQPKMEQDGACWVRIEVQDTGIGIAPEAQNRLFTMFTQADASTTRRFGGTGLGLVICKRIIELMGGQIGVDSREGVGSTFWFQLPLRRDEQPLTPHHGEKTEPNRHPAPHSLSQAASARPAPHASLRILVAEDNHVNQQVAVGLLTKLGHRADVADHGGEAVARLEKGNYDLILMDMQMPHMDGIAATRMIRSLHSPKSRIPIIAVTANAMNGDRERCLDAGMDDYISKPIDRRKLAALLQKWHAILAEGNSSD